MKGTGLDLLLEDVTNLEKEKKGQKSFRVRGKQQE